MRILKFGGSSLATAERIKNVIGIIKQYQAIHTTVSVVVSAQGGVTDQLVELCRLSSSQKANCEAIVQELEQRHLSTLQALLPITQQPAAMAEVMSMCNELADIIKGVSLVGEVTPRTHDLVLSFGERLSAYVISQILKSEAGKVEYTDARQIIRTDAAFGHAKVNFEVTDKLIQEYFAAHKGLNVVTGFIASSAQGQTTTLGRSGSDYTASIVGAALQADVIEIWTDVDGVMTADPRFVNEAQNIEQLSYNEAMELSHFGANVIFPATMQPAMAKQIPILVKNTFNPTHKGTLICNESGKDSSFIKGIASLKRISLINIEGSGMIGIAGVSARIFGALSQERINVILISQASSEHSICIGILQDDAEKACRLLELTFAEELLAGLVSSIFYESGLAIVAVVGENMRQMPGVASRIFNPLGRNGINIKAISQGSSELNISIVILEKDMKKALSVLHQSLFNYEIQQLHLYVAGTGAVGSKLLEIIESQEKYFASKKISIKLCGLINSRKMIVSENNISMGSWKAEVENNAEAKQFESFVEKILKNNMENSVFVDATASAEPVQYYNRLLSGNIAIVAANKRANSQAMEEYTLLQETARKRNTPFHYETNVGAGLPVINVVRSLLAGGDKIMKIEAVLSGTLNYLMSEYDGVKPFSDLVKLAKESGYTEPDPRDDLSGMDVARKCLILARECGWQMELSDIDVEALTSPEAMNAKGIPAFFEELKNYNKTIEKQFKEAAAKGNRLRYIASIEDGKVKIALMEVDASHPFFSLKGTENCLSISSKYYQQYPMVIKGPGAGVNVTAAGVLADIVRISEELKH